MLNSTIKTIIDEEIRTAIINALNQIKESIDIDALTNNIIKRYEASIDETNQTSTTSETNQASDSEVVQQAASPKQRSLRSINVFLIGCSFTIDVNDFGELPSEIMLYIDPKFCSFATIKAIYESRINEIDNWDITNHSCVVVIRTLKACANALAEYPVLQNTILDKMYYLADAWYGQLRSFTYDLKYRTYKKINVNAIKTYINEYTAYDCLDPNDLTEIAIRLDAYNTLLGIEYDDKEAYKFVIDNFAKIIYDLLTEYLGSNSPFY